MLDVTAVQSHAVPDRDFIFENSGLLSSARVQHAVVLHVRAITDADVEHVTARDGAKPDGRLIADMHIANYLGAVGNESRAVNLRVSVAKWANHSWVRYRTASGSDRPSTRCAKTVPSIRSLPLPVL